MLQTRDYHLEINHKFLKPKLDHLSSSTGRKAMFVVKLEKESISEESAMNHLRCSPETARYKRRAL